MLNHWCCPCCCRRCRQVCRCLCRSEIRPPFFCEMKLLVSSCPADSRHSASLLKLHARMHQSGIWVRIGGVGQKVDVVFSDVSAIALGHPKKGGGWIRGWRGGARGGCGGKGGGESMAVEEHISCSIFAFAVHALCSRSESLGYGDPKAGVARPLFHRVRDRPAFPIASPFFLICMENVTSFQPHEGWRRGRGGGNLM